MANDHINFDEASRLVQRYGPSFGGRGVVGIGIGERENALRFIVAVANDHARERLAKQYQGRDVAGFPVFVETRAVRPLQGAVATALPPTPVSRAPFWREVMDRPGYLVLACVVLVALALIGTT